MINAVRLIHIRDPRFYRAMPKWALSSLLDVIFYSFIISMILVQILQPVVEAEIAQFYQHIGISLADPSSPFSTQLEFTSMLYLIWITNQSKKRTDWFLFDQKIRLKEYSTLFKFGLLLINLFTLIAIHLNWRHFLGKVHQWTSVGYVPAIRKTQFICHGKWKRKR